MLSLALLLLAGVDAKITVTVKRADVVALYNLAGEVAGMPVTVDACLEGKQSGVDVQKIPVSAYLAKLDQIFGATHAVKNNSIHVTCAQGAKGIAAKPAAVPSPSAAPS